MSFVIDHIILYNERGLVEFQGPHICGGMEFIDKHIQFNIT